METAVIALIAGALGAGLTGLLQLRRDRVEALRQRQLDAADAFAAAVARVLLQVKLTIDTRPKDQSEEHMNAWRERNIEVFDTLPEQVQEVAALAPRVELLFGVASPAAVAAVKTAWDLGQMAKALRPPINPLAFEWAYKLAGGTAMRFHDEANVVVAASWWRRHRHESLPDEVFEEMLDAFDEELDELVRADRAD